MRLTKTVVDALEPESGKQFFVWDSKLPGFGVRVSPGGSKSYMYQGRINGTLKKITIGRHGVYTAEQARKEAKDIGIAMSQGQDPSREKNTKGGSTLGDLLTAYVDLLKDQGKESADSVKSCLKRDVEDKHPKLWKKQASQIDLDDCIKIIGTLKDEGKLRQADKLRSYIRTAFSEAINARGDLNMPASMLGLNITYNPARDLRKVKGAAKAKDRALSLSEFRCYWKRAKELPEPRRSLAMLHVLTGGQRQQQLARVTLADIDRDTESMTIWDKKGRRSEPRQHVVPLLPQALELINGITGAGSYVFSADGGTTSMNIDYLNDIAKSICAAMKNADELEGPEFTGGAIRATIETRLIAKPYRVSSDVLGHLLSHGMGGVQQRHYQHHSFFDEKLEALEMLYRMAEGQPEPIAQVLPFVREA